MTFVKGVPEKETRPVMRRVRKEVVSIVEDIGAAVEALDSIDISGGRLIELVNRQK